MMVQPDTSVEDWRLVKDAGTWERTNFFGDTLERATYIGLGAETRFAALSPKARSVQLAFGYDPDVRLVPQLMGRLRTENLKCVSIDGVLPDQQPSRACRPPACRFNAAKALRRNGLRG